MQRRTLLKGLGALLAAAPATRLLAAEGDEYTTLPQAIPGDGVPTGKIEVIEFFHYGCPHCRHFDPTISAWIKKLPEDVYFHRIPVTWNKPALANLARVYYSLAETSQLDALHERIFPAVQDAGEHFVDADAFRAWAEKQDGANAKALADVYGSFGMGAMLDRGQRAERAYKVMGVPMMAVAGLYTVSGDQVKTHTNEGMLPVVDMLIDKVRKAQKR